MTEEQRLNIADTIDGSKKFMNLVKNYSKIEIIDKGSSIISAVVMIIVVIAISTILLFCVCMALYHTLLIKTNDPVFSYMIMGLGLLLLCVILIMLRRHIILNPIIKLLSNIMFKEDK